MLKFRTDFSPTTAPIATLVQSTLFDSMTITGQGPMDLFYSSTGGVLTGIVADPCMRLLVTGATPVFGPTYVRKWITYSPAYDDPGYQSSRPTHLRFRCNVSADVYKCFTGIQERFEILRFMHNSGATGSSFAGIWWQRSNTGWKYRLEEYLWSGATVAPSWDFASQTLLTFTPYIEFAVDVINVPGASVITVGQPYPATRTTTAGGGQTGIANEGYCSLAVFGVTLPRISGIEIGMITFSTHNSTLYSAGEIRFDNIKVEDDLYGSADQERNVVGGSQNPPYEGYAADVDIGNIRLFNSQNVVFGAPNNGLYSAGMGVGSSALATKTPACNVAVEPNACYMLLANTNAQITAFGSTVIAPRPFASDSFTPDMVVDIDCGYAENRKFFIRTGPHQNSVWITCSQAVGSVWDYTLKRIRG